MNFRPKKYLGQNFLIDNNIQKKIVSFCRITPKDTVLEIGAGRGELTRLIAKESNNLFALEVDRHLYPILIDNLVDFPWVKIINQDILKFDILRYFKYNSKIKVIGNLPYNITTPIIVHLLRFRDKISNIFITVQKEFAQRMVAHPGESNWGALSCLIQYYTLPEKLLLIKRTCFRPQPKVDSALVRLTIKQKLPLDKKRERQLFKVIRFNFQQRRKMLRNALSGVISTSRLNRYFKHYKIDKSIRGEELSLQDFINLVNIN